MTGRIQKVNSLLEHELAQLIQREVAFPEGSLVTLTHVDCSPNLIEAKAYISIFPEEKAKDALKALDREVSSIQHQLNTKLNMRPIPKIIFVVDKQGSKVGRIEEILQKLRNN